MKWYFMKNKKLTLSGWGHDAIQHLREHRDWVENIIYPPKHLVGEKITDGQTIKFYHGIMWPSWLDLISHCGICTFIGTFLWMIHCYPSEK